jgi:CHAD domain-containing protein
MAKAWQVEGLRPDAPLIDCARRILETRFREVLHYRRGTIAGRDIEQLHSMRVSTRRLRSAMRNFSQCFDRAQLRYHTAQIKEIADRLGAVRDLDVRIAWLKKVRGTAPEAEHAGIDLLIARARRARAHARRPMAELLATLEREGYERSFLEFLQNGRRTQEARRG